MRLMATLPAMLLLTACASGTSVGQGAPPSSGTTPAATSAGETVLQPPEGRRWVGIDDVVVAVPERWGTETQPCAEPEEDTVFFIGPSSAVLDCATVPTAHVSSLTIASTDSGAVSLGRRVDLAAEVNDLRITHSGIACRAASTGPCTLTLAVPGSDAAFHVIYRGTDAEAFVDGVLRSVTRLPSGQTTVPLIDYGTSVVEAEKQLIGAGLVGQAPDVNFPHYATGTNPPAGSVVEVGQVVELTIGDG